jgi:hypothetical protein
MKPAGLKTTEPRNSADHRSGLSLSVAQTNSNQFWWASVAFGLIWKKEDTLAHIAEENRRKNPAKRWFPNRQISVDPGR